MYSILSKTAFAIVGALFSKPNYIVNGLLLFLFLSTASISYGQCANTSPTDDCDGDGVINNIDSDDDDDGLLDNDEIFCATDVLFNFDNDNQGWVEDNQNINNPNVPTIPLVHSTNIISSMNFTQPNLSGSDGNYVIMDDREGGESYFESPDNMNLDYSSFIDQKFSYHWINGTYDGTGDPHSSADEMRVILVGAGGTTIQATHDVRNLINNGTWNQILLPLDQGKLTL